jgi:hypothetical protein
MLPSSNWQIMPKVHAPSHWQVAAPLVVGLGRHKAFGPCFAVIVATRRRQCRVIRGRAAAQCMRPIRFTTHTRAHTQPLRSSYAKVLSTSEPSSCRGPRRRAGVTVAIKLLAVLWIVPSPGPQAGSAVTGNLDAAQALPLRTGLARGGLEPLTLAALRGLRLGMGLAARVCPASGLVVTSGCLSNALSVWRLSASSSGATVPELTRVCTLGGEGSAPPMWHALCLWVPSDGWWEVLWEVGLPSTHHSLWHRSGTPLLLVTDGGHDAVHVIDMVGRAHVGYVASPGTILVAARAGSRPGGVAVQGSLVAISAWRERDSGDHVVHLFKGSGSAWEAVRVIGGGFGAPWSEDGQLHLPLGLRFSGATGAMICVADCGNARACLLRVEDGGFVRHVALDVDHPFDVEEVACGWLACYESGAVEVWGPGRHWHWQLQVELPAHWQSS